MIIGHLYRCIAPTVEHCFTDIEILTTEDLNEVALLRIFDGVTAAFYKSDEYNSREYRYSNLSELRKAMKHKEGGTNGKAQ